MSSGIWLKWKVIEGIWTNVRNDSLSRKVASPPAEEIQTSSSSEDPNQYGESWWFVRRGLVLWLNEAQKSRIFPSMYPYETKEVGKENALPNSLSHSKQHGKSSVCINLGGAFERKRLQDLPDDWVFKETPRKEGGVNRTFYEPRTKQRFRSLLEVFRYLNAEKEKAPYVFKQEMTGTRTIDQAAKLLKNKALAVEKRLKASIIEVYDETRARPVKKAKVGHTPTPICRFR